jgi:hypothetical protein
MNLSYKTLKKIHRDTRDGFPESLALRTHRALSWLKRAEEEKDDPDAKFLFLWIAFNAAYANELPDRHQYSDKSLFVQFLFRLIDSDEDKALYKAIWDNFAGAIRLLIDNRYVFQPFWDYQSGQLSKDEWEQKFQASKSQAHTALGRMDTKRVITVMFDRLYVLRNQMIHGGSTWNSSINRSQVEDAVKILGVIVPIIILLMMNRPNELWGDPCYPVVK